MPARRDRTLSYVIGFGLLVVGLTLAQHYLGRSKPDGATGAPAPDVSLRRTSGETVALRDMRGRVVLLDFWARWCTPCVTMMPSLDRLARTLAGRPFELLSVNIESAAPARIDAWLKERGLSLRAAQDPEREGQRAFAVNTLPRLVLIDKAGVVRKTYGVAAEGTLAADVTALLD